MESSAESVYAAFEDKVKKTLYIDNLSPQVTESVLKCALNQFGYVKNIQFIPNYTDLKSTPSAALVEMENPKQAEKIVADMSNFPFMMSGMPRPVRACAAELKMFDDRPRKPGRKIHCCWLDPKDPDFEVANKIKHLTKQHATEASFLLKQQLAEEEKLANQQSDTLRATYKKVELLESVLIDGTAKRLERRYNIKALDA